MTLNTADAQVLAMAMLQVINLLPSATRQVISEVLAAKLQLPYLNRNNKGEDQ